ncbi:MAG TPA: hypothetical protein VKU61_03270 [Candidatus Binatia bacterium]|nr:hypothetical protein [Candidatus Binatia bacterium]
MLFSRALFLGVAVAVLCAAHVRADEVTTTAPPPTAAAPEGAAEGPPKQETVVNGTPPRLLGRWLAVSWIQSGGGRNTSLQGFWQITEQDGKPALAIVFTSLPEPIKSKVNSAVAENQQWTPTAEDLALLRERWDKLPIDDSAYSAVWNEISAPDGFDEGLKTEERTKDALFVVRQRLEPKPGTSPIIRQVFIFAVTGSDGDVFTGNFDGVMVAAAPMPMPIPLKGSFRLYHIEGPPVTAAPRGILARLLDVFRGCRR